MSSVGRNKLKVYFDQSDAPVLPPDAIFKGVFLDFYAFYD